jgi:hypothetical protein
MVTPDRYAHNDIDGDGYFTVRSAISGAPKDKTLKTLFKVPAASYVGDAGKGRIMKGQD